MPIKRLTMLKRLLDVNNIRCGIIPSNAGKPCLELITREGRMPICIPEDLGVPSRVISDFLEELNADKTLNMHNVVIARRGRIICEAYFGAHKSGIWKATFSACKSVTSIAIGMLIDEGRLSLETTLEDIFPREMRSITRLRTKNITVYDLLTMRTGMMTLEETGAMNESELFSAYIDTPLSAEPGKKFFYNSTNTYVLSCIVKKITGEGLSDYLEPRLFEPLGIRDYYWSKSAEGIEFGGWGLYITPCDFAKIGMMIMDGGIYEGRRLLSKSYIDKATSRHATSNDSACGFDYGLHMWVNAEQDQFLFNGMLGQNVWGFKKNGIVIVSNAGNDELFQQSNYFDIVNKYFDRAFPDELPKNFIDKRHLDSVIREIAVSRNFATLSRRELQRYRFGTLPSECSSLNGITLVSEDKRTATVGLLPLVWQVVENNYAQGFRSLAFSVEGGKFYLDYSQLDESYRFEIGFGEPKYTNVYIHNTPFYIAATGCFAYDEDGNKVFKIRVDFLETPCSMILKLIYNNGYFEVYQKELPGKLFVLEKIMAIKDGISQSPLIMGVTDLAPDDVIEYQVERMFEFKYRLKIKK